LGFAIIPLIHFVSDKASMGEFAIRWHVRVLAWLVTAVLVFLNVRLVVESSATVFEKPGNIGLKILIVVGALIFIWLFIMMTVLPLIQRHRKRTSVRIHGEEKPLVMPDIPQVEKIAIALEFGKHDEKLIAYALAQGKKETCYLLLHIVETVSAKYFGASADDYETREDMDRLQLYAQQLKTLGYTVDTALGYKNRVNEIVRIVKESHADMLVMGAHRHSGLKDLLYGETVDKVRHKVKIPVLIV
jgi:manganese transport protein